MPGGFLSARRRALAYKLPAPQLANRSLRLRLHPFRQAEQMILNDQSSDSHPPPPETTRAALSPAALAMAAELGSFRREMLRFAHLQLRDQASAEDAVQETMLAALEGAARFAERAKLKTWAFSILRHKIVDIIRRRVREPIHVPVDEEIDGADFDPLFKSNGHWQRDSRPSDWGNPEKSFENQNFWMVFEACLQRLPPATARVFMMREMLGLETSEICQELSMSSNNCWVVLHRARMALRLCLEQKWFASDKGAGR